MGLFGGGNSRTENTTNLTESNFQNIDNRVAEGESAVFGGNVNLNAAPGAAVSGVNVTTTDYAAVQAGIGVAVKSLDAIRESNAVNNQTALSAVDKSLALAGNSSGAAGAQTTQQFLKYGAIVAVIGLIAFALARFRKRS